MRRWIRKRLLAWYEKNGRDFAWRHTTDPYQVLMAEMMVQRTQARQAEKVWKEWVAAYPTIEDAARSPRCELLKRLGPLGLRWRAKNIVDVVKMRPSLASPASLRQLPGVARYVENATACFAFQEPRSLVDANVLRVLARLAGATPTDHTRRSRTFLRFADSLVPESRVRDYNWALLDLGATVCGPRRPSCDRCPLAARCLTRRGA